MPKSSFPNSHNAEIRKHYYLERYVIVAPGRSHRPDYFAGQAEPHTRPADNHCPFCHVKEQTILGLPTSTKPQVKVIPNIYPALSLDNAKAYGVMEVVIETPNHDVELSALPVSHIETILHAYIERLTALKQLPGIRYVLAFKNDGPLSGASIAHAHSQIIAYPLVPPHVEMERDALNHYRDIHNTCAICDLTTWELGEKVRLIRTDSHVVTVAPYASNQPYEAWIIPRRHVGSLSELTSPELRAIATSLKQLATRLDANTLSFNFFLQESLPDQPHHLVIKLEPRVPKFYAGAELGTGIIINTVTPEEAVVWYNQPSQK